MKRGKEPEPLISNDAANKALEVLNSPADKSDITKNNEVRLEAGAILGKWTNQAEDEDERKKRETYINVQLGVDEVGNLVPPSDAILSGAKNKTGIITPTSRGTGLPEQTKAPKDLRSKE